jgi:hypothetical protein
MVTRALSKWDIFPSMMQMVILSSAINKALTVRPSVFQPESSSITSVDGIIDEVFLSVCSPEERNYWIKKMGLKLTEKEQ